MEVFPMAKTNVPNVAPHEKTHTHEGTPAQNLTPLLELRRSCLAHLLWEDEFYESGEHAAKRVADLVAKVPAIKVAELAYEARTRMKLRHLPLWLAIQLNQNPEQRHVVGALLPRIIQRPDELTEFLSLYWGGHDRKRAGKPLSAQVKMGLARAFTNFDAYALAKYNRDDAIKLRDVLFMVHAKPKDEVQAATWKQLVDGTLPAPDTWEVELSAGKDKTSTWVRLIAEQKLGALALLRNLRNMKECKVPDNVIKAALDQMKVERVLPFRFITAARYAPTLEPELERAMFRCLAGIPKLKGKTALVVDTSPSMWGAKVSAKSEMDRFEAAAALAILARELCSDIAVYAFNEKAYVVPARRGFALRDALSQTKGSASCGGLAVEMANKAGYDRIIVLTDGQWHYSNLQTMQPHIPSQVSSYWGAYASVPGQQQHLHGEGNAIAVSPPPLTEKAYMINVASYQRGVGYGKWTSIDGWSEAVLDYVSEAERLALG
jgi:60 kDa SS-A/Ro ribonucleoprotein